MALVLAEVRPPGRAGQLAHALPGLASVGRNEQAPVGKPIARALEYGHHADGGRVADLRPVLSAVGTAEDALLLLPAAQQDLGGEDAHREVTLADLLPRLPAVGADGPDPAGFVHQGEDVLHVLAGPVHRRPVVPALDVLDRRPRLATLRRHGRLAVQHEARQPLARGVELERVARLAPPADGLAVDALKRRALVGAAPDPLAADDHVDVPGGSVDGHAGRLARPGGLDVGGAQLLEHAGGDVHPASHRFGGALPGWRR